MKFLTILFVTFLFTASWSFAQVKFPVEYRVDKQSMSTPMTPMEDIIFLKSYFTRPVNVEFNGSHLKMFYDNGEFFTRKEVTNVAKEVEYEDNAISLERFVYTDNKIVADTILFVVDHNVGYVQVILPTKNSKGENIGYTSYRQFVNQNQLVLR